MPAREIATTIKLDGEKKFNAALQEAQRNLRVMNSDLKAAAAEFKFTGDKQQQLTEKSRILSDKVAQQDKIVAALSQAVKDSAEKYGDVSKQTDNYRMKLNNATATLFKFKQQLGETTTELENLGKADPDLEFKNALDEASRSMRLYQSEAKLLGVTYRNNGQDADFLAKKSQNLKEQIAAAEKIYVETAEAMKRSAAATGDMSEQTLNLKLRTNEARITLTNLRRESEDTDRSLEELGRDSKKIGRQIKDGIGDAAEETSESLDDMIKKLSSDIGDIKGSTAFTAISAGVNFVTGSIGKIVDFVDSSREYRNKHALATNAIEQNLNASEEEINQLYLKIVGVTGDTDSAHEALVTLSKTGAASFTELNNMLDMILGAYIQFGEEAKPEDVAESLQESVSTGTLTGKIAELYERLGMDVEAINKAIKDLPPKERLQAIMNGLTGKELTETYRTFAEENQNLITENQKLAELENSKAALADELSEVTTFYYDAVIKFVNKTTVFVQELKEALKMFEGPEKAMEGLRKANPEFASALESGQLDTFGGTWDYFVDHLFGEKQTKVVKSGKESGEAYEVGKTIEAEEPNMIEILSAYSSGGEEAVQSLIDSFKLNDENKSELLNRLRDIGILSGTTFKDSLKENTADEIPRALEDSGKEAGEAYVNAAEQAITDEVPTLTEILSAYSSGGEEEVLSLIDSLGISDEDKAGLLQKLKDLGILSGQNYDSGMQESMKTAAENAVISGANIGTALKNGLDSTMPLAIAAAQSYYSQLASLNAAINTTIVSPRFPGRPSTGGTGAMTANNTPIILEMNGRELGRGMMPTINSLQGRNLVRSSFV